MKQVTFVFSVRPLSDADEHPQYAYFQVTAGFLDQLQQMRSILQDHGLSEVRMESGPEYENEAEYRMDSHELVVTPSNCWFRAYSKHSDCDVETHAALTVDEFVQRYDEAENNSVVYVGNDFDRDEALDWYHEAFAEFDT